MEVQVSQNNRTKPFVLFSNPNALKQDGVIGQDAARSAILYPFTVLGKLKSTVAATAAITGTGDGTCTAIAKLADGKSLIPGTYNLECTAAVTNGGTFKLEDPNGALVADGLVITAGAGAATVFNVGGLTFTITDGATDFIVGDAFAIIVTANGDYWPLKPDAVDGRAEVAGIYVDGQIAAADLVAGDISDCQIMIADAYVDENQIVLENSLTLDSVLPSGKTVREELAQIGIIAEDTVSISDYEN